MTSEHSSYKSRGGLGRLVKALRYSLQGLRAAFRHEAAFRQELLGVVILTPVAFWAGRGTTQILLLIGALVVVLIVEILNSALEALADSISTEPHPLLGRAKDLGSAAVLLAIALAAATWLTILLSGGDAP
ncbi:MAG: diacylglycerol kinase [Candidimonas sp.]|nr:MAG: diacylglycerol kinase [Candidimonas sp.]